MKNILQKIKSFINGKYLSNTLRQQLIYDIRNDWMINKALNCKDNGITDKKLCDYEIIVSVTTYGKRLYDVASTIESIMQGSMKPNHIILWLGEDMKDIILPIALKNQQNRGLEIAYCKDIRSYTKLVPSLRRFPEATIITIDDDLIYSYDLVEKLVNMHKMHPQNIIANRMHRIKLGKNGKPLSYMNWEWLVNPTDISPLNFFTGVGGVPYPPHSLDSEVLNEEIFLDICKYADDIWFNAMALKKGTNVLKCYTHNEQGEDYIINPFVQDIGLCNINTGRNGINDKQLKAVFERYDLWNKLQS